MEGMRAVIAGGHGQVGLRLGALLAARGDQPVGLIRAAGQAADLEAAGGRAAGARPGRGHARSSWRRPCRGADAVVFSAGAGGRGGAEATNAIDGEAAVKLVDAAAAAGVRRFVMVSVFMDAGRGRDLPDTFENYMRVKRDSDVHLAASDLDWTILRPGTLTDDARHRPGARSGRPSPRAPCAATTWPPSWPSCCTRRAPCTRSSS